MFLSPFLIALLTWRARVYLCVCVQRQGALVGALAGTPLDTGVDPVAISVLNDYWEDCRGVYAPFESGQKTGSADVYEHEVGDHCCVVAWLGLFVGV